MTRNVARQCERCAGAELGVHREPPAPPLRGVLGGQQRGAAPLAADGEPLREPQQHQDDRCGDADRRRAGQQPDRDGRQAHQGQRGDQGALAAEPVAQVPEQRGPERAGEERHREGADGRDRARCRAERGEEHRAEDEGGGRAVDEEVVELDRGARERGERDPSARDRCIGHRGDGALAGWARARRRP
jgi:hypothetical protein